MPEPKRVLTEEDVHELSLSVLHGADFTEVVRHIEQAVLAKRDAQWREAAKFLCDCFDNPRGDVTGTACLACCIVARMEAQ